MTRKTLLTLTTVVLLGLFFGAKSLYKNQQSNAISSMSVKQAELFERPHSWSVGPEDAKVHLVEFFDPACETCAQFHPLVKQIMKENKDKIRLTLRYAPFHHGSADSVKMLEAARKQGKFNETLEMMFATQRHWTQHHEVKPEILWDFMHRMDLDMDQLVKDIQDPSMNKLIEQDLADAQVLGAKKTPSYFVNGKPLQEFGYEQLKELIYSEF